MIPIELTIEGIYSYQERQTIDFSQLTAAGLFGVFGSTGSGKSSVLEAISYALYGETERMNSRDNRAYNMLNLKSDRGAIDFVFLNWENKKYKAVRGFRRNSKKFEDVKPTDTIFYEWLSEQWIPVEKNAEQILNLSYNNFKRTIIIPQGQFREFLELGDKARTDMMEEIFQLHRFDLSNKARDLRNVSLTTLTELKGKLSTYEEVSTEKLEEQKVLQEKAANEKKVAQAKFEEVEKAFQELKKLKEEFDDMNLKRTQFKEMQPKNAEMTQLQAKIEEYERVFKTFSNLLENLKKIGSEIWQTEKQSELAEKSLGDSTKLLADVTKSLEEITHYFNILNAKRQEEADLEFIGKSLVAEEKIKVMEKETKEAKVKVSEVEGKQKVIDKRILEIEAEVKTLKPQILDASLMMNLDRWFNQKRSNEKELATVKQSVADLNKQVKAEQDKLSKKGIDIEKYADLFKVKVSELEDKQSKLQARKGELEVQQKLAEYAHTLHDGVACPLCGSQEHPHIAETANVGAELTETKTKIELLVKENKSLQESKIETDRIVDEINRLLKQIETEKTKLDSLETVHKKFLASFDWKDFRKDDFDDFEAKKQLSETKRRELESKEKELDQIRKEKDQLQTNFKNLNDELAKLLIEENGLQTEIKSHKENLKQLKFDDFQHHPVDEVRSLYKDLKTKNDQVEEKHKSLTQQINELNAKVEGQKSTLTAVSNQLKKMKAEQEKLKEELGKELTSFEMDLAKVKSILSLNLDVTGLRQKIQDFRVQYKALETHIQELEKKLAGKNFSDEEFAEKETAHQATIKTLEEKKKECALLEAEIKRIEKLFEEKKELIAEAEKLELRTDNLNKLFNLFTGKGFVNFISSIYLKQLVVHANARFHRMTRNQLSLTVNDKNDFEIIDYLNEGKTRSVKTLSGGQSFQVSLSLALALAESVQAKSKTEQNFFFIDEGFGTQDNEAVNLVFETLLNLNKENKIVGIISHVEELKERIPASLTVVKDEERGSLVN